MGTAAVDGHWSTPIALVTLGWGAMLAACFGAAITAEAPGKLLLGVAAALLALLALHGSIARPRLAADDRGLAVRGLLRTRHFEWAATQVRVRHTHRLGRTVATLELESGQTLLVLSRLDLGTDPEEVAAQLHALRS